MKTTNYYLNKMQRFKTVFLFLTLTLMSCTHSEAPKDPEPSENPVSLTAQAQSKEVWVKYINMIGPENKETDKVTVNHFNTATSTFEKIIENDWIKIIIGGVLPNENIKIIVTENTLNQSRTYKLTVLNQGNKKILTIIQAGKS